MDLFQGFFLSSSSANMQFAHPDQALRVAPLKSFSSQQEAFSHLQGEAQFPAFAEKGSDPKTEYFYGLKEFVHFSWNGIPVFIFDNHNHALFFRSEYQRETQQTLPVLHLDQHSDMNENMNTFKKEEKSDRETVFDLAEHQCNVGNFIKPAIKSGIIKDVQLILTEYALEHIVTNLPEDYLLDIDLDFRAPEMGYHLEEQLPSLKKLLTHARMITIATSPYFIDQKLAIELIKKMF